jgi:hypothetical protein
MDYYVNVAVDNQRRIVTTPPGSEENIGCLPAIGLTWEF